MKYHQLKIIVYFFLILTCLSLLDKTLRAQENHEWVSFYCEKIDFILDGKEMHVIGDYYFQNLTKGNITMTIVYPFPVDELHPFPYDINVSLIEFTLAKDSIVFPVELEPSQKKIIKIEYRQIHSNKSARYILMTTQNWLKPLEHVEYTIKTPRQWKCELSIEPDCTQFIDDIKIYSIIREDFFPEKDLIINWD